MCRHWKVAGENPRQSRSAVIAQHGIHIIENYDLEEIAAAKEYEFLLVVPPLKIRGGTGSALRSFALVP